MSFKCLGIDQSERATGIALLDEGSNLLVSQVIGREEGTPHFDQIKKIVNTILGLVTEHKPRIIAMEDYARSIRGSASLIPLVELGGCIKAALWEAGYRFGRESVEAGSPTLLIQNQASMKKFCLANGAAKKDTAYLLNVMQSVGKSFQDDNMADAYMHAWKARIVVGVLEQRINIDDLPIHQQEALISVRAGKVKGLSLTKALKLSGEKKLELVTV